MTGGAIEQICFDNCSLGTASFLCTVKRFSSISSSARSCKGDVTVFYESENNHGKVKIGFFKSLLLPEIPKAVFRWNFKHPRPGTQGLCHSPTASEGQSRIPASGGPINPTAAFPLTLHLYIKKVLKYTHSCLLLMLTNRLCHCVLNLGVKLCLCLKQSRVFLTDWAVARGTGT